MVVYTATVKEQKIFHIKIFNIIVNTIVNTTTYIKNIY
jgi:hypothetical protein